MDPGTIDPAAQAEARRFAVGLVKSGMPRFAAADTVGVNWRFVAELMKAETAEGPRRFRERGAAAVRASRTTQRPPEEEDTIRKVVTDKCPDQLKLPLALLTREAVAVLIERYEAAVQD